MQELKLSEKLSRISKPKVFIIEWSDPERKYTDYHQIIACNFECTLTLKEKIIDAYNNKKPMSNEPLNATIQIISFPSTYKFNNKIEPLNYGVARVDERGAIPLTNVILNNQKFMEILDSRIQKCGDESKNQFLMKISPRNKENLYPNSIKMRKELENMIKNQRIVTSDNQHTSMTIIEQKKIPNVNTTESVKSTTQINMPKLNLEKLEEERKDEKKRKCQKLNKLNKLCIDDYVTKNKPPKNKVTKKEILFINTDDKLLHDIQKFDKRTLRKTSIYNSGLLNQIKRFNKYKCLKHIRKSLESKLESSPILLKGLINYSIRTFDKSKLSKINYFFKNHGINEEVKEESKVQETKTHIIEYVYVTKTITRFLKRRLPVFYPGQKVCVTQECVYKEGCQKTLRLLKHIEAVGENDVVLGVGTYKQGTIRSIFKSLKHNDIIRAINLIL
jgi:hypothetical protein